MRFLITGYKGQLGYEIAKCLLKNGDEDIIAIDKDDLDITDSEKTIKFITEKKPDIVFHCAAYTQVDKAEECEELVYKVNVLGTKSITEACKKINAKLFYFSTDYVFDGEKNGLYKETDTPNPKSVYGETKYLGEKEVLKYEKSFIIRISWVFGINGHNFIKTMIKLSETKKELSVVSDQIGSPTYTVDLANLLIEMLKTDKYGIYHVNNDGYCSWAEFAEFIFKETNKDIKINHVTTEEYLELTKTKQAYRPRNSKLCKEKLINSGFSMLPTWQDATKRYIQELKEKGEC
ncbi:MAG: dTDP-4-dehydrorhamnose reductase [Bacilli bacterium]|nr:dTDP-4-dehydrorhamnose reductase [Bacilli bacterium]